MSRTASGPLSGLAAVSVEASTSTKASAWGALTTGLLGLAKGLARGARLPPPPSPPRCSSRGPRRSPRPATAAGPRSLAWARCWATSSSSWPASSCWARVRSAKPSTATVERRPRASCRARAACISLSLRRIRKPPGSRLSPWRGLRPCPSCRGEGMERGVSSAMAAACNQGQVWRIASPSPRPSQTSS